MTEACVLLHKDGGQNVICVVVVVAILYMTEEKEKKRRKKIRGKKFALIKNRNGNREEKDQRLCQREWAG